jgi:uroporphyrinogen decarboxylase
MNSLERVMSAITGSDTDFQPFTMLLSLYGARLINSNTIDFYTDAAIWFNGQKAVVDAFDPDIVIAPFSFPIEASAFGSELVHINKNEPNIKKPIITDLSQIKKLQLPDYNNSKSIQFLLNGTDLIAKNYIGHKAIGAPIQSPADMPALLMGVEMWIDTLLFHPKEVEIILEKTVAHFVKFGNELLARGASFLIVPVNFTNPMMITERMFSQLIPHLQKAFSQIKGPIIIHNGGCKILPFIDRFVKLPNVIALVLEPSESFEKARQIIGDKIVLMGNLDGPNLINLTEEKASDVTMKILNNRINDKYFIFASSNADIPYNTPVETIKAVVDTIRNFKKT